MSEEIKNTESNEIMENDEQVEETTQEESTEESSNEDADLKAENAKLRRLLKKQEKSESKEETKEQDTKTDDKTTEHYKKDLTRLEIRTEGYKDKEQIDFIMGIMDRTGDDLDSVLADEFVVNKLKKIEEHKKTKNATPTQEAQGADKGTSGEKLLERLNKGKVKYNELTRAERDKVREVQSGSKY